MKALELVTPTNSSVSQYAHRGCAGIARQLHPLKAIHSMRMTGSIDSEGSAYDLMALYLASSTNSSESHCAYRGCAGIGRQLHPLKADTQ